MKKLYTLLLIICCVISLCGCHGSRDLNAFVMPEELTSEQINLVFWAKNDTNKTQADIYNKAIEDFNDIYPNIHITIKQYSSYPDIYNDVITNIATQTTPNICITYPDHIATYLEGNNIVAPLDELINDEKYGLGGSQISSAIKDKTPSLNDEVLNMFLEEGKINGVTYSVPFMRSSEACYINEDMVKALGYEVPDVLTWDFIFEVSLKAMEKNEDGTYKLNNQNVLIPFMYKSTDNMMIQYLIQKAKVDGLDDIFAYYSSDDGDILMFNQHCQDLLEVVGESAGQKAFSCFTVSSYPGNFINAGQCIFAIDSTAGATWMGSRAPLNDIAEEDIIDFNMVVRMVPQVSENPDDYKMISQGPSICIFNKNDNQEVLASWLFVQFLLNNDIQIAYAQTEGYIPVTSFAQEDMLYKDYLNHAGQSNIINGEETGKYYQVKIDATKLVLENRQYCFVTPVFNGSASLRSAAGTLIDNVVKSTVRNEYPTDDNQDSLDAYYDDLFAKVISLKKLDQVGSTAHGQMEFGQLPSESKALLISLVAIWTILGFIALRKFLLKKKGGKK